MRKEIEFTVDYNLKLLEMFEVAKLNIMSRDDITEEYFPLPEELLGKEIKILGSLFNYDKAMKSEEVVKDIKKEGFNLGLLPELLAFDIA